RAAFLLPAVNPIRKRVVRAYVIELRGRLVIPRAPRLATVHGDDRALVRAEQNGLGIVRVDPNILVIVTAGRAAPTFPILAAVRRLPTNHARRINDLRILRIESYHRQIAAADSESGTG